MDSGKQYWPGLEVTSAAGHSRLCAPSSRQARPTPPLEVSHKDRSSVLYFSPCIPDLYQAVSSCEERQLTWSTYVGVGSNPTSDTM